ncbi:MAG: hypothetical protein FJ026_17960 [Chloroflexi bacterium]|nr:hypothetical protein [Chloroflexota bacterium]
MSLRRDGSFAQRIGIGKLFWVAGLLCLISLGVVLGFGLAGSVRAAPGPGTGDLPQTNEPVRVYLDPSSATISQCGTLEMNIQVQAVPGLWGIQYMIRFDPNILEVVDVNPTAAGIQIYPAEVFEGKSVLQGANSADNAAGKITYSVTMINPQDEPFFGSGSLGRIVFRPKGQGASLVSFDVDRSHLVGTGAREIPTKWEPATVTQTATCRDLYLPVVYRNWMVGP